MGNCCCRQSNPSEPVEEKNGLLNSATKTTACPADLARVGPFEKDVSKELSRSEGNATGKDFEKVVPVQVLQGAAPHKYTVVKKTIKATENGPIPTKRSPDKSPSSCLDSGPQTSSILTVLEGGPEAAAPESSPVRCSSVPAPKECAGPTVEVSTIVQPNVLPTQGPSVLQENGSVSVAVAHKGEEQCLKAPSSPQTETLAERLTEVHTAPAGAGGADSGARLICAVNAPSEKGSRGNVGDSQVPPEACRQSDVPSLDGENHVESTTPGTVARPLSPSSASRTAPVMEEVDSASVGTVRAHTDDVPSVKGHASLQPSPAPKGVEAKQSGLTDSVSGLVEERVPNSSSDTSFCLELGAEVNLQCEQINLNEIGSLEDLVREVEEEEVRAVEEEISPSNVVMKERERGEERGLEVKEKQGLEVEEKKGLEVEERKGLEVEERKGLKVEVETQQGLEVEAMQGLKVEVETMQGLEVEEKKGLEVEEKKGLEVEERKGLKVEVETKQGLEVEEKKSLEVKEKQGLKVEENKRLEVEEKKGLKVGEEQGLKVEENKRLEVEEKKGLKVGEEQGLKVEVEAKQGLEEKQGLKVGEKQGLEVEVEAKQGLEEKQGLKVGEKQGLEVEVEAKQGLEVEEKGLKVGEKQGLEVEEKGLKVGEKQGLEVEEKGLKVGEKQGLEVEVEAKQGLEVEEKKGLKVGEKQGLEMGEKQGLEVVAKKRLKMEEKKGLEVEERKGLVVERKGLEKEENQGLEVEEKQGLEVEEKQGLEVEEKQGLEVEEKQGLEVEEKQGPSTSAELEVDVLPVNQLTTCSELGIASSEEDLYRGEEELSALQVKPPTQLPLFEITLPKLEDRCSLAPPVDILCYSQREWKGNTAKSVLIRKGYSVLSQKFGSLRRVRGDNYCALRATLFQVLSQSTKLPAWLEDIPMLPEALQARGGLIDLWLFPAECRQGDRPENAVQQLKRYMELLQTRWQSAVSCTSLEERQRLCERVFQRGEEELGLMEALKVLMLGRALELHASMQQGEDVPIFCWLLFARDTSECPRTFLSNHLRQVGFSGGLEQVEMFLLGYALQCTIQAYRLYMTDTEEFLTYYPDDHKDDWPGVCLVTEDDRHYNVPVGETVGLQVT